MKNYIRLFYADVEVGAKLTLDGAAANKTMKEFKQEIKAANEELLNTSARFGATSKEALAAAKRVAELKDNIQDANETAKLFDPGNKFQVLGNAVRGLVGGFTALQGALALVGVEGEEVQKTLLKVQGALALTEGLNTVADVTKDFKRLGSVLVQTLGKSGLIGVAIAGVAALAYQIFSTKDALTEAELAQNALSEAMNDGSYKQAIQDVEQLKINIELAKNGFIDKEKVVQQYNSTIGKTTGEVKNLDEAEKALIKNADAYISYTLKKAVANKLLEQAAKNVVDQELKQQELLKQAGGDGFFGVGDDDKALKRILANRQKASEDNNKSLLDLAKKYNEDAANIAKQFNFTGTEITSPAKVAAIKARVKEEVRLERELRAAETAALPEVNLESIEEQERLQRYADGIGQQMTLADRLQAQFRAQVEERIALAQLEEQQRTQAAYNIGSALGALSQLIGEQTAAGKALAIAQAVINTWLGVTEVLKTKSVLPEPLATISRIANITAVVASGLNAVKNIGKARVPGASGGGGGNVGSVPAPIQPRPPQATNTVLDQGQLNQIGNAATVRAFVVESDVSSNQERIRRLNRAARI